jgi:hypothetical protein
VAVIELEKGSGKINISTAWRILDALGLIDKNIIDLTKPK